MAAMENPGALAGATGADLPSSGKAAGTPSITNSNPQRQRHGRLYRIEPDSGGASMVRFSGRVAWALDRLIDAGAAGVTPIERPAPRWSAYIRELRLAGVPVETIWQKHGGAFPGRHGRYVLRAVVRRV